MSSLVAKFAGWILLLLVELYRRVISPVIHTLAGPGYGCRFHPSCSEYARDALRSHGPWAGGGLAARRVFRCHPGNPGGWDPVPMKH